MRPRRRSPLTLSRTLGPLVGIAAAAVMVVGSSDAAFTANTSNQSNTYSAATVSLVDDDSGSALMQLSNLVPGDSATKCITVNYTGSTFDLTPVKLYAALASEVDGFASHVDMTISVGTGGSYSDCTGFTETSQLYSGTLSNLAATNSSFATGITGYTPASGSTSRTYKFVATLGSDTPDTAQGDSVTANFTWEVQSA
ncbi:MAG: TasA family protein [Acidimicrobiales bacterium]